MAKGKKKIYRREEDDEPGLDISSLIDVSFQLLIYFLVTTTLQPKEVDVGLSLPSSAMAETPPEQRPLTLKLNSDGSVIAQPNTNSESLGSAAADYKFPQLVSRLETYKQMAESTRQEPFIVIQAEDDADQQSLMNVFNAIAQVEIRNVTLSGFTRN